MNRSSGFSRAPDDRLDFWAVVCWLAIFLALGAVANIVAVARMAMS